MAAAAATFVGVVPSTASAEVAAWAAPTSDADRTALLATIDALDNTSHQVEMETAYARIQASIDPRLRAGTLTDREGSSEFDETVGDHQVWIRLAIDPQTNAQLGISPTTWMSLDLTKLPPTNNLPIPVDGSDPVDMPGILAGVTAVYRTSSDVFSGTVDLRKIIGRDRPDAGEVRRAGVQATRAPFSAVIDERGRLADFAIDTESFDPALRFHVWFHNYGAVMSIPVPSRSVPAPDAVYTILSG
jgi:hypothetical protein